MADTPGIGIELSEVSFSYRGRSVLERFSLTVASGEVVGVVGRSGIGKTTLLNLVAGLYTPSEGRVSVGGRIRKRGALIRGVVMQEDSLLGWLTAEENVAFPQHRSSDPHLWNAVREQLDAVGLAGRYAEYPAVFSTGMRKRLEFARALRADSEYVLADEPFGTLDFLTRTELWRVWLKARRESSRTGILSTHDPEEAIRLCDKVVVLRSSAPTGVAAVFDVPAIVGNGTRAEQASAVETLRDGILQSMSL